MTSDHDRWDRVKRVFQAVLEHPPDERERLLREQCGDDQAVVREVESLLLAHAQAGDFAERPPIDRFAGSPGGMVTRDEMSGEHLAPGTRIGPYEIDALLGAGGMGEVYRSTDLRLGRTVALKILPDHLADPERLDRFEREGRAISTLTHPHICTLYDVGKHGTTPYLVMEYLEGETLHHRLESGHLTLKQAFDVALQIADALDLAHRKGVIHRDLKPGNIMLTRSGVKLLDFGLAKMTGAAQRVGLSTEHIAEPLTRSGSVLGTLPYMAPEQLAGQDADRRADIFAFGAIVYEMVTGRRAFEGGSQAALMAGIVTTDPPPISDLLTTAPPGLDQVVRRCLAKDPDDRWQTAGDAAAALRLAMQLGAPSVHGTAAARPAWRAWALGGLLALLLLAVVSWFRSSPSGPDPSQEVVRFTIDAAIARDPLSIALSPDGRQIAYVRADQAGSAIWVHRLDSVSPRVLPGTEGAIGFPFWSPDGRFLAFRLGSELKRVDVGSGVVTTIVRGIGYYRRGVWGSDDTILFGGTLSGDGAMSSADVIHAVPAAGGEPAAVTRLDAALGEVAHSAPSFLPDGRHFLYKANSNDPQNRVVYIGSRDPAEPRRHLLRASRAMYLDPGLIVFARERTVYVRRFDPVRLEFTGDEVPLLENILYAEGLDTSAFDASSEGTLIAAGVVAPAAVPLVVVDREHSIASSPGLSLEPPLSLYFSVSPDGKRVAFSRGMPPDLWTFDIERQFSSVLTTDPDVDHNPIWSPDGSWIAFDSHRGGRYGVYRKAASGAGAEELLFDSGALHIRATDWSHDGQHIVVERQQHVGGVHDIWVIPLSGDREPSPYLQNPAHDLRSPALSPDGRWMAYDTNESGEYQVVVQPFPDHSAGKWPVSTGEGRVARWGSGGRELYYVDPGRWIVRAETATDPVFAVGTPARVQQVSPRHSVWDMTPDAQRLIVASPDATNSAPAPPAAATVPIHVVLNWPSLVEGR